MNRITLNFEDGKGNSRSPSCLALPNEGAYFQLVLSRLGLAFKLEPHLADQELYDVEIQWKTGSILSQKRTRSEAIELIYKRVRSKSKAEELFDNCLLKKETLRFEKTTVCVRTQSHETKSLFAPPVPPNEVEDLLCLREEAAQIAIENYDFKEWTVTDTDGWNKDGIYWTKRVYGDTAENERFCAQFGVEFAGPSSTEVTDTWCEVINPK